MQSLSVDQLYKKQLAEFPAILNSFYTNVSDTTSDYIEVEVRGGRDPGSDGFSNHTNRTLPDGLILGMF